MSDTTKRVLLLLGITTVAAGGYVAYSLYKKKKNEQPVPVEEKKEEKEEQVEKEESTVEPAGPTEKFIFADNIAKMPDPVEIEKTEYATKVAKYSGEEDDDSENDETWEAYKASKEYEDYRKENKNKISILPEGDIEYTWTRDIGNDPNNPDVIYEEEELYYFTEDATLTDEDGNIIDEDQYLGPKPRQFGWFTNNKEEIYIRNNPLERDFRVNKVQAERSAYFN